MSSERLQLRKSAQVSFKRRQEINQGKADCCNALPHTSLGASHFAAVLKAAVNIKRVQLDRSTQA